LGSGQIKHLILVSSISSLCRCR